MLQINQLKIPVEEISIGEAALDENELLRKKELCALKKRIIKLLRIPNDEVTGLQILKKSLDARKKPLVFYVYSEMI